MTLNFNPLKASLVIAKFSSLVTHVRGDLEQLISGVSPQEAPTNGTICFVADAGAFKGNDFTRGIVVLSEKSAQMSLGLSPQVVVLSTKSLQLAMAKINSEFFPSVQVKPPGIHPSAYVSDKAKIDALAHIGPFCFIEDGAVVGPGSQLVSHVYVGPGAKIASNSRIESFVYIGDRVSIGNGCVIHSNTSIGKDGFGYATDLSGEHFKKPHYGSVIIEDGVELGSAVNIDRGTFQNTVIGAGTKVDNMCHIAHNLKIGKRCLITAGFIVAGSTEIGDNCVFGGGTLVAGHIKVGSGVQAAGHSTIHKSVSEPGQYGGYPFQPLPLAMKNLTTIGSLADMRKDLAELKQKLKTSEQE